MAGFSPNELREEERRSGFEPGLSGDETFHLENLDAYPGSLPETSAATNAVDDIFSAPMSLEEALKVDVDSLDDLEDSPAETESAAGAAPDEAWEAEAPAANEPEPAPEQVAEPEPEPESETAPAEEELVDSFGAGESEIARGEAIALGEELRALLMDDLAKSEERKKVQAREIDDALPESAVVDKADIEGKLDIPEDLGEDAIEIDLGSLNRGKHPSQSGLDVEDGYPHQPEHRQPAGENTAGESADQKTAAAVPKRRKGAFPWRIAAALVLFLLAGAFASWYFLLRPPGQDPAIAAGQGTPPDTTTAVREPEGANHQAHAESSAQAGLDNVTGYRPRSDTSTEPMHYTVPADTPAYGADIAADTAGTQAERPRADTASRPLHTPHTDKQAVTETAPKHTLEKKAAGTEAKENFAAEQPAVRQARISAKTVQGEYVVQIYSTPSLEDAEDWLNRLQKKPVQNAFITTQKIRDKVWYRVRFGMFSSQAEAEARALALGFDNSWVVRIR